MMNIELLDQIYGDIYIVIDPEWLEVDSYYLGVVFDKRDKDIFLQQRKHYIPDHQYEIRKIKNRDLRNMGEEQLEKLAYLCENNEMYKYHEILLFGWEVDLVLNYLDYIERFLRKDLLEPFIQDFLPVLKFSEKEHEVISDYLEFLYRILRDELSSFNPKRRDNAKFNLKKYVEDILFKGVDFDCI